MAGLLKRNAFCRREKEWRSGYLFYRLCKGREIGQTVAEYIVNVSAYPAAYHL